MKPCSHVVCKVCVDKLVRVAKQCIVCDHTLGDKDMIELKREGMYLFNLFGDVRGPCGAKGLRFVPILIHYIVRHWLCRGRYCRSEEDRCRIPGLKVHCIKIDLRGLELVYTIQVAKGCPSRLNVHCFNDPSTVISDLPVRPYGP